MRMELKIVKETEEPLLKRKKIIAEAEEFGPTPKKDVLREAIAKQVKAEASTVAIFKVAQEFGTGKSTIVAYVYKDAKMADLLSKEGLKKRIAAKKAKAAPAAQ